MNTPAELEITAVPPAGELPGEFQPRTLRRRALQAIARARRPGRDRPARPGARAKCGTGWRKPPRLAGSGDRCSRALSFASYVLMFGPIFCTGLSWRRSWQIGGSELAMGSLVPASGAGGLALGAWVLHRGGMDGERIARRSVAFFLIKSGVNFLAVAVIGAAMALGLVGPDLSLWLTAVPGGRCDPGARRRGGDPAPRPRTPPGPEARGCAAGQPHADAR